MTASSADRTLASLLADLASAAPSPSGGAAAGWSCALAAALVEMSARVTLARADADDRRKRLEQIATRAAELREQALEIAEADQRVYAPVLSALRLPPEDPQRAARLDAALSDAAEPPLALARTAAETGRLAHEMTDLGSVHVRGDALTGLALADAACRAAAELTRINLRANQGDPRLAEVNALARRARAD